MSESKDIDDGEVESDASKSNEIGNDKEDFIYMTINDENLDAEIARLCSKRREFNPSVAKSKFLHK